MSRVYSLGSWFSASMAVALLAMSLMLVPQSRALADGGGVSRTPCPCSDNPCGIACTGQPSNACGNGQCAHTPPETCGGCGGCHRATNGICTCQ